MGLDYPYQREIDPLTELKRRDVRVSRFYGVRRLAESYDASWSNNSRSSIADSNLDHVLYAADHLKFNLFPRADSVRAEVEVRGWTS